jgi:hypothetical protein
VLAIHEKALGPAHPDQAISLTNLARLYQEHGQYAAAEPLVTRALTMREAVLGPAHPDVGASLNNLAALYQKQSNPAALAGPLGLRVSGEMARRVAASAAHYGRRSHLGHDRSRHQPEHTLAVPFAGLYSVVD